MKKAFDQNVSRAKPRLRLGSLSAESPPGEEADPAIPADASPALDAVASAAEPASPPHEALTVEIQTRAARARQPKKSAAALFDEALRDEAAGTDASPRRSEKTAAPA